MNKVYNKGVNEGEKIPRSAPLRSLNRLNV